MQNMEATAINTNPLSDDIMPMCRSNAELDDCEDFDDAELEGALLKKFRIC